MSLSNLKNEISFKQFSIIINLILLGALIAVAIIHYGPPEASDVDEKAAESEAAEAEAKHQHTSPLLEGHVTMTDRQLNLNGIEILVASPARIKATLKLIGDIRVNADKSVQVVPRLSGIVESVSANAGDHVKKGQLLAVIASQSIADQRSELMAAQKRLELARVTYAREKQLWEEKISAEQDYLQVRQVMQEAEIALQQAQQKLQAIGAGSPGRNLNQYEIRSTINGTITDKLVSAGQVLNGNETIFTVSDLSTVWAEMRVYAQDINTIKVGQKVTVKATAFQEQAIGTVSYVGSIVGETSRTAMARVVLANEQQTWKPGLPVNIELSTEEEEVPLAVSIEGLQNHDGKAVVFVRTGNDFEIRPIQSGKRDEKYVEVLSGLKVGDRYAAANSYLVKAELGKASASHDD